MACLGNSHEYSLAILPVGVPQGSYIVMRIDFDFQVILVETGPIHAEGSSAIRDQLGTGRTDLSFNGFDK